MIVPAGAPRDVRKAAAFVEALQGILDEFGVVLEPPEEDDEEVLARFGLKPKPEPSPTEETFRSGSYPRPRPVMPTPVERVETPFALAVKSDRSLVLGLVVGAF